MDSPTPRSLGASPPRSVPVARSRRSLALGAGALRAVLAATVADSPLRGVLCLLTVPRRRGRMAHHPDDRVHLRRADHADRSPAGGVEAPRNLRRAVRCSAPACSAPKRSSPSRRVSSRPLDAARQPPWAASRSTSRTVAAMANAVLTTPRRWTEYSFRPFVSAGLGVLHASETSAARDADRALPVTRAWPVSTRRRRDWIPDQPHRRALRLAVFEHAAGDRPGAAWPSDRRACTT